MSDDRNEGLRTRRLVFWHEIRSPAATLQTLLEVLGDGLAGQLPEAARDLIDRARRQAARVTEMITSAHDLERLLAGRLPFSDEPIDLREALRAALKSIETAAAQKKVVVELREGATMHTQADPAQVARCLLALARAALECSHRDSSLIAEASRIDGGTSITVHVEALAKADALADALEPTCSLGLREGNGIGLYEARLFVEAMGGKARVVVAGERATLELWFASR